jgi:hypothetical protein
MVVKSASAASDIRRSDSAQPFIVDLEEIEDYTLLPGEQP